jgi:hypothetical protein
VERSRPGRSHNHALCDLREVTSPVGRGAGSPLPSILSARIESRLRTARARRVPLLPESRGGAAVLALLGHLWGPGHGFPGT